MKKLLSLVVLLGLSPLFAGCGDDAPPPADPVPETDLGGGSDDPGALDPLPTTTPESGSGTN
ncbi:MAG: hypothetical protein WD066_06755 [Planctomycetaceae bacterium]